jgi:Xaa-Pro aminopeptidase
MHAPASLPFGPNEYLRRHAGVREEMERRGIDVLFVTKPANIHYLTGYDACWYPWRLPLGVAILLDSSEIVVLDWTRHADYVNNETVHTGTVLFEYADAVEIASRELARLGPRTKRFGLEWSSPTPSAPIISSLAESLGSRGAAIVAGDWTVDTVALYKSEPEVAAVRRAAVIADSAMTSLGEQLRPGMTQIEASALLTSLLVERGSEYAATNPLVSSGPDAWRDIHGSPSSRRLQEDDIVSVDCCAVVHRYHANLGRTFALGRGSDLARETLDLAAGSIKELQRHARIDEPPEFAAAKADEYVRARVPEARVWWVGGYSLGVGFPPSWVGHTYLANDGLERCVLRAGYVSNFETVFVDRDEGFSAQSIDTVLMTDDGLEVLSSLPRTLLDADA